jgi:hypothetical protein
MSELKRYIETKEYIVTLYKMEDLESFRQEMESIGHISCLVPERSVACTEERPISLNTHYLLTDWEAEELKSDIRVRKVNLHPNYLGIKAGELSTKTQTSSNWNKSNTTNNSMLNFSLLRCTEGVNRSNWGSNGTNNQTGTVVLDATGKNVDVVIIDGDKVVLNHPEYAKEADGSGGTRFVQYNWFQHNPQVTGTSAGTYGYTGTPSSHATHVAGTACGSTQGWARDANIYNIFYFAGASGNFSFPFVMDYVREFHRTKPVNPETGRKNPTITNNSWGMSIFPDEWSFSDITAVTYRGIRYTPSGDVSYTGVSGVCSSNERLAQLVGFENIGNRIVTSGSYNPPGGDILTIPEGWTVEGNQASFTSFAAPASNYDITIEGPARIDLLHNIAVGSFSGSSSLYSKIEIKDSNNFVIDLFEDGPFQSIDGTTIETRIEETIELGAGIYTISFVTDLNIENAVNPIIAVAMNFLVEDDTVQTPAASVTEIPNQLLGPADLASFTIPTTGTNDDGFWNIELPFNINYLGNTYSNVYVGTNSYLTFSAGSSVWQNISVTNPNLPKIMWGAADNSVQRIYHGVEGTAPNRTYRIRVEGNASTTGTLGSPGMLCEYVFYEATPNQIDLQLAQTNRKTVGGGFTTEQLNAWGFISGQRIPVRVDALDSDIEQAIKEGIIYVGAAGNGKWKHDVPGGPDWNNTFEMANRYPSSVSNPYYYMRGSSPTANDNNIDGEYDLPNICVGSIDITTSDQKATYSDCGPGVDIYAPGTSIISAYTSGVSDSRGSGFLLEKISGTSMASPQVCGVIACALELNPHWNQEQAKSYITGIAKQGQITATSGGPADDRDLQGSPNLYLFYRKDRPITGLSIPRNNQNARPSNGQTWPRPKIYRFG